VSNPTILPGVVTLVEIKSLKPDPGQPRQAFDEASLLALADNIRERGVQQPLLVRSLGAGGLQIVDGERRWRAAKLAKLKSVPVLLVDVGELDQLRLDQVSVNQLREQLKPMELARVLKGLRDAGKTTNDIAATLAKQGLPAMRPAAIDELADLTALPDWAQAMVNAEQVEPKDAARLLPILELKGVEKPLEKSMRRSIGYTGKLLGHQVRHSGEVALKEAGGTNLGNIDSWSERPVVHFAWKTRCKGCEHLQRWGGGAFCMSRKTFEEHNQEAKDAGLLPGGKRPQKRAEPKPGSAEDLRVAEAAAEKAEQRERSLAEKARDYLHARLCVALIEEVPKRTELQGALVLWRALGSPGSRGTRGARPIDAGLPTDRSLEEIAGQCTPYQLADFRLTAALNILNELPWRETHALARLIWGNDLHTVWNLDREFLDLFRKSELVRLAVTHGCDPGEGRLWDRMKGEDIKDALLAEHDKLLRPQILADLYQGEIEPPYKPWRPGDDEDEDDEDDFKPSDDEERDAA
jgi:ParB/RepB/Spo0J family partition protein